MEDLRFNSQNELNSHIKNFTLIGEGSEGKCYRLDKKVFKLFHQPHYQQYDGKDLLQFSDVNIDNYVFAQNLIYLNNQIIGVIMPYVEGNNIFDYPLYNVKYDDIIEAFSDLMKATKKLSDQLIRTNDVFSTNILYYDSKFYIVDTAGYKKMFPTDIEQIENIKLAFYLKNMKFLSFNIYNRLFTSNIYRYLKSVNHLNDYDSNSLYLEEPILFLTIVKSCLNSYCGKEIYSIAEADKVMTKRR